MRSAPEPPRARAAARRHSVHICAGLIEWEGNKIFNAAVLIGPDGQVLLHHRKINELEIGHAFYALGKRLAVAPTPLGTFGIMICADAFAPGQALSRALALMGADLRLINHRTCGAEPVGRASSTQTYSRDCDGSAGAALMVGYWSAASESTRVCA